MCIAGEYLRRAIGIGIHRYFDSTRCSLVFLVNVRVVNAQCTSDQMTNVNCSYRASREQRKQEQEEEWRRMCFHEMKV